MTNLTVTQQDQQLPMVQPHSELVQAVSARDLYKYLGPTERFSSWFERQVQYGFTYGIDFIGCEVFNTQANQMLSDYFLSMDMAKQVSMVQRSEKGKEARTYFIDCEKKLQEVQQIQVPKTLPEALRAYADEVEKSTKLQIELKQAEPKINHYNKVVERKNLINATQVGEKLDGMSAIVLNRHLTELGVYNRAVKRGKVFSTWFIQKGYGEMKQSEAGFDQPLFTQLGQAWVIEQLTAEGVA